MSLITRMADWWMRSGGGGGGQDTASEGGHLGVHVKYEELYKGMIFLALVWFTGQVASRVFRMPALVGEILMGILLGPSALHIVPFPQGWVLFGEIGLVMLVLEAGFDVDYPTLKLIGVRGAIIACVGTFLPITVGMIVGLALGIEETKSIIAAGCTFGPTSVGIALNVLKSGQVLNTPIGQLVVSAAVIDDMIALLILTQLQGLVGTVTLSGLIIPVFSALAFLLGGGAIALFVLPPIFDSFVLPHFRAEFRGKVLMMMMFAILLAMMPATYYGQASYLMGAFISGLAFCSYDDLHHEFIHQFKPCMQWLMRVFFAASIGFQVPIQDFFEFEVIWKGLLYCLPWAVGKQLVGLLAPNLTGDKKMFHGLHRRDCLIVANSMASEGEFAFVIAVFNISSGLIEDKLYASLVLSVLLSTIIPPFLLRFTINHYKNRTAEHLRQLAEEEAKKSRAKREEQLAESVFLCIQTQSIARWGLLWELMATMSELGLDIIDHRVAVIDQEPHNLLVTEAYVSLQSPMEQHDLVEDALNEFIEKVKESLKNTINSEDCTVEVQRWNPGVVEEVQSDGVTGLTDRLMKEAAMKLNEKKQMVIGQEASSETEWSNRNQRGSDITLKGYVRDSSNEGQ